MLVCWVIPGMPLFWKPKSGAVVAAVGRVPTPVRHGGITEHSHVSAASRARKYPRHRSENSPPHSEQLRR